MNGSPSDNERAGLRVRDLRAQQGMTQHALVNALEGAGLSMRQQTIVKIERGTRPLRLHEARKFAEVFAVDVHALIEGTDETQPKDLANARIGKNVAALRSGISQQALADLMQRRGWRWSQATVWAVERGSRSLHYSEAVALSTILGVTVDQFSGDLSDTPPCRRGIPTEIAAAIDTLEAQIRNLSASSSAVPA